jgi:hypothetical protein
MHNFVKPSPHLFCTGATGRHGGAWPPLPLPIAIERKEKAEATTSLRKLLRYIFGFGALTF